MTHGIEKNVGLPFLASVAAARLPRMHWLCVGRMVAFGCHHMMARLRQLAPCQKK